MKLRTLLVFTTTFLITTHGSPCTNTVTQETQRKTDAHVPSFKFFDNTMKIATCPIIRYPLIPYGPFSLFHATVTPGFFLIFFCSLVFISFCAQKTCPNTMNTMNDKLKKKMSLSDQEEALRYALWL
ncbi:MAG: hypothetical protein WBQ73_00570 [Candidatus Babeliales bacterium]